jgi:hypothetical protein
MLNIFSCVYWPFVFLQLKIFQFIWLVIDWIIYSVSLLIYLSFIYLFVVLGLELTAYTFSHSTSPFLDRIFQDRVSRTVCLDWLWTSILLVSASQVARITGMSHCAWLFMVYFFEYFIYSRYYSLLDLYLAKIFSHFIGCVFNLLIFPFAM